MTLLLGAMVSRKAQISMELEDHDPENPLVVVPTSYTLKDPDGNVRAERDILETLGAHVAYLEETGVMDVLNRGATPKTSADFMVPGLAPTDNQLPYVAKTLKSFLSAAKSAAEYVHDDSEQIDGDAGGRSLGGPHAGFEDPEGGEPEVDMSGDFDQDIDLEGDGEETTQSLDSSPLLDDMDPIERKIPEKFVDRMAKAIEELESTGVLRRMSDLIGRDGRHHDEAIFSEGKTTMYGSLEDFMQGDGSATADPADKDYKTDTYGYAQMGRLSKDRAENLAKQRPVVVMPGRGFLKDTAYKPGGAGVAARKVKDFVNTHLVDENGAPNIPLRMALKRMADRPVVATTEVEAKAWKEMGQQFVAREMEEHKLRLEAAEEKAGLWSMTVSRRDLGRLFQVVQAQGEDTQLRVQITDTGGWLGNENTPLVSLKGDKDKPAELAKVQTHRTPGGMIALSSLQAAIENMDQQETKAHLIFSGERPKGLVSDFIPKSQQEKLKAAKPRGLEPNLPDVL
jgi:hypothetical protein